MRSKTLRSGIFWFLQRNIRSIKQFVSMKEDERRALLRNFTDDEYRDVMNVCASLPNVTMEVSSKGKRNDKIYVMAVGSVNPETFSLPFSINR